MEKLIAGVRLLLVRGDITRQCTEAIVNAANSSLLGGGGVDGAIHRAGGPQILEECRTLKAKGVKCPAGNAVITGGGKLAAKWVIHTVGPVWQGGGANEAETLSRAYHNSLLRALEVEAKTVAFPSISTGAYSYPVNLAADVAVNAVKDFLEEHANAFSEIRFVLFDDKTLQAYAEASERFSDS